MLPDLSFLSFGCTVSTTKRKRSTRLQDVNWINLSNNFMTKNSIFSVNIPKRTEDKNGWTINMLIERGNIFSAGPEGDNGTKCVEILRLPDKEGLGWMLESLFVDIDKEVLPLCGIKPSHDIVSSGQGNAVMQVLDVIASSSVGSKVKVTDQAEFINGRSPKINCGNKITHTLVLSRGYGYYEARGFVSDELIDRKIDHNLYGATMQVDLDWTHMVCTSSINDLVDNIRHFYECVVLRSKSLPEFTLMLYSKERCDEFAKKAKNKFVDDFKRLALSKVFWSSPKARSGNLSFRELMASASTDEEYKSLSKWSCALIKHVWQRSTTINDNVVIYPGEQLTKIIFYDSQTPNFNGIVGNQEQCPVVQRQSIRNDITVDFDTK